MTLLSFVSKVWAEPTHDRDTTAARRGHEHRPRHGAAAPPRGRGRPERARPRDPGVRAPVVEVRRVEGAGHQGALRHELDPVLPGAQRAPRQPVGPRGRPDADQAPAPDAHEPAAGPHDAPPRYQRLTPRAVPP